MIWYHTNKMSVMSLFASSLLVAGLILMALPVSAYAEETAVIIKLSYVRGYSTWGPTNVFGAAQLWPREGVATLRLHDLPPLANGARYISWIVNTTTGDALQLGGFDASQAGDASLDVIFNQAMPRGANAILVTVMNPGDPPALPGPERSAAGYFPSRLAGPVGHSSTSAPGTVPPKPVGLHGGKATPATGSARHLHSGPIVVELPRTGGGPGARRPPRHGTRRHGVPARCRESW